MAHFHYLGIMTNYRCTAACRHCLYCSSPAWQNGYLTPQKAEEISSLLHSDGVREVHIGGGEPFLDFEGLCALVQALGRHHIGIQYIETNAYWCYDHHRAAEKLRRLKSLGVDYLMVSCDPFHAEFVPLRRVIQFIQWCQEADMGFFVWKEQYLHRLLESGLSLDRPHTRAQLEQALGKDYIRQTAAEYGLGMNGRALNILEEYGTPQPIENLLAPTPCPSLTKLQDGHVDLEGMFLPGNCTGIALAMDKVIREEAHETYPLYHLLSTQGLAGLYDFAVGQGFSPAASYPSRCAFCFALRAFLSKNGSYPELYPAEFYDNRFYKRS